MASKMFELRDKASIVGFAWARSRADLLSTLARCEALGAGPQVEDIRQVAGGRHEFLPGATAQIKWLSPEERALI